MARVPYVSVVVPAFCAAAYLPQLCRSIQCQTFSDFEVLIGDDGSPDNIYEAVRPFLKDSRFVFYKWSRNRGVAAATLELLQQARGEFWCYPGADDLFEPEFIKDRLSGFKENPNAVLVHGPAVLIRENDAVLPCVGPRIQPEEITSAARSLRQLLQHNFINTPGVVVKMSATKKVLPYFSAEWKYAQDWSLWILLAAGGGDFIWQGALRHRYRIQPQSLTQNKNMLARRSAEIRLVPLVSLRAATQYSPIAREVWKEWGKNLEELWLQRKLRLFLQGRLKQAGPYPEAEMDSTNLRVRDIWKILMRLFPAIRAVFAVRKARQQQAFFVSGLATIDDPIFRQTAAGPPST